MDALKLGYSASLYEDDKPSSRLPDYMTSPILNVLVVDFHHARGPEIEFCFPDVEESKRPESWNILSFQALPDGSHLHDEDYSYFTVITGDPDCPTAFGISCNRQLKSTELKNRPEDVTRSTIQKAIVVLTSTPHVFAHVKDKLGAVTRAYFSQLDFTDRDILEKFHEALVSRLVNYKDENALFTGMPVRRLIHDFRWRVLTLLKALLLEKRILYFGTNIEQLCTAQYSVLSLLPGLLEHLEFCGDPSLSKPEDVNRKQESLKTSDRSSVMRYMGMPLQPFNKGAFFGPYTPLQQVDLLEDPGTNSYMIGTSNSLFLHAKDRHCDVLVNVDTKTIEILDPSLKPPLAMSTADRKWAEAITTLVEETWDPRNPDMPNTRTFAGSEENIRAMFERYIFSLCAVVKYDQYLNRHSSPSRPPSPETLHDIEHDAQMDDYGRAFIRVWKTTENFRLFNKYCDDECFDITEPRHPVVERNLTVADVQARLSTAVQDLKLDERTAQTRAAIKNTWTTGSSVVGKFFSEASEVLREQRKQAQETNPETVSIASKEKSESSDWSAISKPTTEHEEPEDPSPLANEFNMAKSYLSGFKSRWTKAFAQPAPVDRQILDHLPPTPAEIDALGDDTQSAQSAQSAAPTILQVSATAVPQFPSHVKEEANLDLLKETRRVEVTQSMTSKVEDPWTRS